MRNLQPFAITILAVAVWWLFVPAVRGQEIGEQVELIRLIRQVIATHPSAEAARAEVEAASVDLGGSRRARWPGISVESSTDRQGRDGTTTALAIEQPLWTGGRISASIRQAEGSYEAALASLDEVYLDLALRTAEAYVELQALRRRIEILDESVLEHQKLVDSMRRRVEQEVSPASELMLAQSRMRQMEIEVLEARARAEMTLVRLRELAGADDVTVTAPLEYQRDLQSLDVRALLDRALSFDPQRRRVEAEADVAAAEVALRKSTLFPEIGARYLHYVGERDLDDELGLVMRFQSGGGFSNFTAVGAARRREEAARRAVDSAVRDQRERILTELAAYTSAVRQAEAGFEAAAAAAEVTESFQRQFAAGRRTWPEVLNAVREAVTARLTQVDAESRAASAYIRLMLISGTWPLTQGEVTR